MKQQNIDWERVRLAMQRSIVGIPQSTDFDLCKAAYAADPKRYSSMHSEVKGAEIARIRAL